MRLSLHPACCSKSCATARKRITFAVSSPNTAAGRTWRVSVADGVPWDYGELFLDSPRRPIPLLVTIELTCTLMTRPAVSANRSDRVAAFPGFHGGLQQPVGAHRRDGDAVAARGRSWPEQRGNTACHFRREFVGALRDR